jgi:signal transduction histidine kinase
VFLFPVRRAWSMLVNLIGIVLVGLDLAQRSLAGAPVTVVVAAWAAWAFWVIGTLLPESWLRARVVVYLAMIAGGSLAAVGTNLGDVVPAAVALLILAGTPVFPLRLAGVAAGGSLLLIVAGALIAPAHRGALISAVAVLLICGLGGLSRRQYRASEAQSRALLEERIAAEQERAQVAGLTERSRIARDLHDVLAHSLGGLVIQLEAVDALLESGRSVEARDRVRNARRLAVSGLDEAKRAVSALREPDRPISEVVAALAETHRSIGGQVAVRGDADRGVLSAPARVAVHRAVQELLTNARRHARGAPTTLDLDWDAGRLTITASTAAGGADDGPVPGGGHGLAGMRERIGEAGGTMTVREGPPFEVVLRLPGASLPGGRLPEDRGPA